MAIFKELIPGTDIKAARSFLNQLVDVIQLDVSGTNTRKTYQVWVTGGVGPGVTSSLFHTVFDQDFSLQTANPVMDLTVGLFYSGSTVQNAKTGQDNAGKLLFPSQTLMMREKVDIYRQFAQALLGDSTAQFIAPFGSALSTDLIDSALFICFKRLFHRDQIKRESFAMKFYQSAALGDPIDPGSDDLPASFSDPSVVGFYGVSPNLMLTSISGAAIFTDVGSSTDKETTFGGQVSNLVDSSNTSRDVGLLFNDRGIVVLDLAKVLSGSQHVSGVISGLNAVGGAGFLPGQTLIGSPVSQNPNATFIPDFMVSASIDDILNHVASTRFSSGSQTAITFQNITNINSTLLFARATADEFNYSSNPSFVDSDNRIVVIDQGQEDTQRTFTFITSVAFYDANDNLLAVAKVSRPVEKNDEKDLTFRCRLDF